MYFKPLSRFSILELKQIRFRTAGQNQYTRLLCAIKEGRSSSKDLDYKEILRTEGSVRQLDKFEIVAVSFVVVKLGLLFKI